MAIHLSDARKELSNYAPTLHDHLLKICVAPNHSASNHWLKEITGVVVTLKRIRIKGRNSEGFRATDVNHFLDVDNHLVLWESLLGSPAEKYILNFKRKTREELQDVALSVYPTYVRLTQFIQSALYTKAVLSREDIFKSLREIIS